MGCTAGGEGAPGSSLGAGVGNHRSEKRVPVQAFDLRITRVLQGVREFTQNFLASRIRPGKRLKLVLFSMFHQALSCLAAIAAHSAYGDANA